MTEAQQISVEVPEPMPQVAVAGLTAFVHALRPDWDAPGIAATLRQLAHIRAGDLGIAMIRAALDPANETPAALTFFGNRAWDNEVFLACPSHGPSSRRTNGECGYCYAERVGDPGSVPHFDRRPPPAEAVTEIRSALHRGPRTT